MRVNLLMVMEVKIVEHERSCLFIFQGQNTYYLNVIGAAGCLVADNYGDGKTELCN